MKAALAITLGVILAFAVFLYFRLGGNKDVTLKVEDRAALKLVYIEHVGPYHQIVPKIQQVEEWIKKSGAGQCEKSYGEYIDDPNMVDHDRLHSRGGCLVDAQPANMPPEFKFEEKAGRKYVVALFEGSPSIGPYKVYPKAQDLMNAQGLKQTAPVLELYQVTSAQTVQTEYLFPVDTK